MKSFFQMSIEKDQVADSAFFMKVNNLDVPEWARGEWRSFAENAKFDARTDLQKHNSGETPSELDAMQHLELLETARRDLGLNLIEPPTSAPDPINFDPLLASLRASRRERHLEILMKAASVALAIICVIGLFCLGYKNGQYDSDLPARAAERAENENYGKILQQQYDREMFEQLFQLKKETERK